MFGRYFRGILQGVFLIESDPRMGDSLHVGYLEHTTTEKTSAYCYQLESQSFQVLNVGIGIFEGLASSFNNA
ncbi:uncharacterized protein CLUP02_00046 [Colletotrichum lupini]|uniref:Uncharacterized protein n=1 Tax=Colletotrichum lupini TaxID=145971 RepID=A0A9Q8W8C9_9PEZI|nr:uncharacterized protein CLUP02_00046 [Colletotrichum lupini]UQC73402.1 hypothetical protein CLUP02_00046 [Colletotrichum lupini]